MKKLLVIGVLLLPGWCYAQSNIVAAEYFFNTDPGVGLATALPAFGADPTLDVNFLAASSGLTAGMHILGIRVRDNTNAWSLPSFLTLYVMVNNPLTQTNISGAEYFFDTDPGVGNATVVSVGAPAITIDLTFAANSSVLSAGIHTLGMRTRDVNGVWSLPSFTPFYIDRNRTITKLEYFFNTDPGAGNATSISVTPATDVLDQIYSMNSAALGAASHTLNVRVAGQNDFWGIAETVSFIICSTATPSISADVVCVGSATTFTDNSTNVQSGDVFSWDFQNDAVIDATTSGNKTFTFPAAGTYTATFSIDRSGCTATTSISVTVDGSATATAGPDQTICAGTTATMAATFGGTATSGTWSTSGSGTFDNASNLNAVYTSSASDNIAGNVTLTFTTNDPPGSCGAATASMTLTINPLSTANAGSDVTICAGSSAALAGSFGGSATSTTWSTGGDGVFNNINSLTAQYTPGANDITSGTVTLTLTTNDPAGPCPAQSDQMIVTISPQATANAGADQSICGNASASLTGMIGGSATSSIWTTSGDGVLSNGTLLSSSYSPGSGDVSAGNVTLTLTTNDPLGPCPSSNDQLIVLLSQPINIVTQSFASTLTSPVLITVTSGGTFNSGDVLTTSILAGPQKGTAQLQSGNVLVYTANQGTVGLDNVQVQVCNQCNQCDTEFIYFDIQNQPPTIVQPPLNIVSGGTITIPITSSIADVNANLDLSTLTIVTQPVSGAKASIDASYNLIVDYTGISFSGTDQLDISVCDFSNACVAESILIEVGPSDITISVYNALSPNGDGKHDFLEIGNVEFHPDNRLKIFNRWGDIVFEITNYNNNDNIFTGKSNLVGKGELPGGTYYYLIEFSGSHPPVDGFLVINR